MTTAILATGDEIVHGDTLNTNSHHIAHALSSEGIPLGLQLSCSDKKTDMVECLEFLAQKHDIIIIIGGLGPTTDDLTRFALAEFTGDTLVEHAKALSHIKKRLNAAQIIISQGNRQQCLFPDQAQLLTNPNGTALGCYYPWKNKILVLLPGPPRECLPMFHQYVLPLLQNTQHSKKTMLKWSIFGLAESEIAQTLEEALKNIKCHTGYRLNTPYVEFKVRCAPDSIDEIKNIIEPILAPHIISTPETRASDALRELIMAMNEPVSIIDEATGGLLESLLVKPGTHHLLKFNAMESTTLSFHIKGLEDYWSQKGPSGKTELSISYSNQDKRGGETHIIPYRSALVVYHAAEWLCFRLFHLINQLHQRIT